MSTKKVTVGCTVNLGNYENLKVEVEAEMGGSTGYYDLHTELANLLGTFGRRDHATAEAIDGYIHRVLGMGAPVVQVKLPQAAEPHPVNTLATKGGTAGSLPPQMKTGTPQPAPVTTAGPVKQPLDELSDKKCTECKSPMTKAQAKVSETFFGKPLCTGCHNAAVEKAKKAKK